ncbi:hypothetical protein [Streptomyces sp. NPDC050145]|uniref:hypothetical protein n=1 Tax=Streptomyces sp. NPDC050145 TaxID=3365602 RepID=UPI00379E8FCA
MALTSAALSSLAEDEWDHRFAALLTVMGRGGVGFDLRGIEWRATSAERARAKGFVLRAVALARSRHRWDELGYTPPLAEEYLLQFKSLVESFVPTDGEGVNSGGGFPSPEDRAVAF